MGLPRSLTVFAQHCSEALQVCVRCVDSLHHQTKGVLCRTTVDHPSASAHETDDEIFQRTGITTLVSISSSSSFSSRKVKGVLRVPYNKKITAF
ncbi:hypothetical protein E2C01_073172 [Portunus trituberculatus]|uniref:Uncharacterized protein n=1 Tax=Portunus trituberculatus TaxID=210409 RepID=A0A5B7ICM8_PORTR|nr:hypothetical protein [Portunus trituberculatus]